VKARTKTCKPTANTMGKKVSDLTLDDEHMTVGVDDTLQEAAKRLLTISGGIVVVLDDDAKVRGVLGQRQLIKALGDGVDASVAPCHQHMEMDFMQVGMDDNLKKVLAMVQERSPQAVVAVSEDGEFIGYFSPADYQEAVQLVDNLKNLNL